MNLKYSVTQKCQGYINRTLAIPNGVALQNGHFVFAQINGKNNISLDLNLLITIADAIEKLYVYDHKNIKYNIQWRTIYQAETRNVQFIAKQTHQTSSLLTIPCHYCGIILPLALIEIDHFKPQTGGEDAAVLKIFRNLNIGLTEHQGSGQKANAIRSGFALKINTQRGKYNSLQDPNFTKPKDLLKNQLTDFGASIKTAFEKMDLYDDLKTCCMNSLLNLVPSCGRCNKSKSNNMDRQIHFYYYRDDYWDK